MAGELYEVAFYGKIKEGADPQVVKAKVAKLFNADEAKLAQLFSGKRIVIKKNIDASTANKYRVALDQAGASCEVTPVGGAETAADPAPAQAASAPPAAAAPPQAPPAQTASPAPATAAPAAASAAITADSDPASVYEAKGGGEVAPPPQTDPLGITGEQIDDLSATIAPVGSELQSEYKDEAEPAIDLSGLDMAPVGSDIGSGKKEPDPPPPDTSGITMAD